MYILIIQEDRELALASRANFFYFFILSKKQFDINLGIALRLPVQLLWQNWKASSTFFKQPRWSANKISDVQKSLGRHSLGSTAANIPPHRVWEKNRWRSHFLHASAISLYHRREVRVLVSFHFIWATSSISILVSVPPLTLQDRCSWARQLYPPGLF